MNKEYIEAFCRITLHTEYDNDSSYDCLNFEDDCNLVDEALERLDKIDNAIEICKKANEQKYVYIKETYGIIKEKFLDDLDYEVLNNRLYVNSRGIYYDFSLKDYGIYWALTKEELENEQRARKF